MKPTNCSTMISGPGVVSAMPSPSSISRGEPVIMLDRLLRDIGEHRIGAAERHHRHLAEEQRDLAEHIGRSEQRQKARPEPATAAASRGDPSRESRARMSGHNSRRAGCRRRADFPFATALAAVNAGRPARAPKKPITPAATMMSGKRTRKKKIAIKATAASASSPRLRSARLPMRTTASTTMASTAAFRPKNSAATKPTLPNSA